MWLVETIEEWCRSADDSLTRVLVVWDIAQNGLIARGNLATEIKRLSLILRLAQRRHEKRDQKGTLSKVQ